MPPTRSLRLLSGLVATLRLVLVLAITGTTLLGQIVGERPASEPRYGPAPSDQSRTAAASDGSGFLVAWVDSRGAIYGTRIGPTGEVLDPMGIRLSGPPYAVNATLAGVLWIDQAYVIIWGETSLPSGIPNLETYVARISGDGGVIDGPRVVLAGGLPGLNDVATNGSRIVLVYGGTVAVLDEHAELIERDVALPLTTLSNWNFSIGSNGDTFLVTWMSYNGAYQNFFNFLALSRSGHPAAPLQSIAASISGDALPVASDGSDYIVLYPDRIQNVSQRISASGELLNSNVVAPAQALELTRALIWTGDRYLAVAAGTGDQQKIVGLRLGQAGESLDSAELTLGIGGTPGTVSDVALATNGHAALLAWSIDVPSGRRVVATVIDPTTPVAKEGVPLARSASGQINPSIAYNGKNYLVVWQEAGGIYASRMSLAGEVLDGSGNQLAPSPARSPRVVYDGANYVVVWLSGSNTDLAVMASEVDPATGRAQSTSQVLSSCIDAFDIATAGRRHLVVTHECFDGRIYATLFDAGGPLSVPLAISPTNMLTSEPRVASGGSEYLVVWSEMVQVPSVLQWPVFRSNIRAARLSGSLTLLDTDPLPVSVSDQDDNHGSLVASDGDQFLVAWTRRAYSPNFPEVRARLIATTGTLGPTLSNLAKGETASAVWDGKRYAIAFSVPQASYDYNLFLTHLGRGEASSGEQVAISATADDERNAALVSPANGRAVAAYERVATEPFYGGVPRIFVREPIPARSRAIRTR